MPEGFFCPVQPPEAVQAVALVEDHVSCVLPPLFTAVGFALSVAEGAGLLLTVTVTLCMALVPPGPVHCAEKVLFDVMLEIVCVPDVATLPLQSPEPVHEVALVEVQLSIDVPCGETAVGFAVRSTVGAGALVTVTCAVREMLPPGPVHCRVKFVVVVRLLRVSLPAVGRDPLQPPEAVQDVVFAEVQVSVELPPLWTVAGLAVSVSVGAGGVACTFTVTERWMLPPAPVHERL